ncbi:MAG: sulfide-dependent adenosine diphosphate thiazole synthase [Euryarchaeota archaeon]|nr:sulfide-dependent adenosine diphosphate thiazole synthase [Euryarchaeota archaeon]
MTIDETSITRAIVTEFTKSFLDVTDVDVALVGAGPANLVAAYTLAKAGVDTVVFERNLSIGGGMWGGGMMFPRIVVQEEARRFLDEFGIKYTESKPGLYVADSIESVCRIAAGAIGAGAKIFNLISAEDVVIRENDRVSGLVLNWTAVERAHLHVDPLAVRSKVVIDGTGHDAEICRIVQEKIPSAPGSLQVIGEQPMWADVGERALLDFTKEVYPGLVVSGMAANAVYGGPRMGPIFGGMMLSGERAAEVAMRVIDSWQ